MLLTNANTIAKCPMRSHIVKCLLIIMSPAQLNSQHYRAHRAILIVTFVSGKFNFFFFSFFWHNKYLYTLKQARSDGCDSDCFPKFLAMKINIFLFLLMPFETFNDNNRITFTMSQISPRHNLGIHITKTSLKSVHASNGKLTT